MMRATILGCAVGLASLTWVGFMSNQARADSNSGPHQADTTRVAWHRGHHWRGGWNGWQRGDSHHAWRAHRRGYGTHYYNGFYYPAYGGSYYAGYNSFYYPGYSGFYYPWSATYYARPFGLFGGVRY